MWFWLLLGLGGVALATSGAKVHSVDEATIKRVVTHALIAERDAKTLRTLQDLLSKSGRFELARLVKARADAVENGYFIAKELKTQTSLGVVTTSGGYTSEQRALEWSKMYGITYEEALRRVKAQGL